MKKQKTHRQKAIAKLDQVFSLWVRQQGASDHGHNTCYTCNVVKPVKELHAGHFVTRGKMATRWDERNVKPQCAACNIFRFGEAWKFGKRIDQDHGEGTADELHRIANEGRKFLTVELETLAEHYRRKLKQ